MAPTRLVTRPPADARLYLQTQVTASFRLDVVPELFEPDNDTLAGAWRQARRLVVVRDCPTADPAAADRAEALHAYLRAVQRRGLLDDYLTVDAVHGEVDGIDACDSIVDAATKAQLGRRDVFLALGGACTGQLVAVAAASYRRWTPALRIHYDLAAVVASIRDGVRVGLSDAPIAALQRASHVLVDEEGVLADRPTGPAERAALLQLGMLDHHALDRMVRCGGSEARAEALAAVLRLCRRIGPGHPAWQLGTAWLPLAPRTLPAALRPIWSLVFAARVAHRIGVLPTERLLPMLALARRLGADCAPLGVGVDSGLLHADAECAPLGAGGGFGVLAAVPAEDTVRRWAASWLAGDGDTVAVPLPTGADDGELVTVERHLLESALAGLPDVPTAPDGGVASGSADPRRERRVSRMAVGASSALCVPAGFPVRFTERLLDPDSWALADLLPPGGQVLAAVDPYLPGQIATVHRLLARYRAHGYLARFTVIQVDATDRAKTLEQVARVLHAAEGLGLGPDDRMLVIGGGTVMDIVGYAAYLYRGDTPYVRVPTTLVGMIDAGIGLKVGVNVNGHKNLMGAYHLPLACVCDTAFLSTLAPVELRCGLAEAIKISVVCDGALFDLIADHHADLIGGRHTPEVRAVLDGSISTMLRQLEANPFEDELRRLPDFGHEFGHMLESMTQFRLRHGEAVAIGMALSSSLAVAAGYLRRTELDRLLGLLIAAGLPVYDRVCDPDALWRKLRDDVVPHKGGKLHLVVPRAIGVGDFIDSIDELTPDMLRAVCADLRALSKGAAS
jgi:2-epi-5-epi-valiolone synthase